MAEACIRKQMKTNITKALAKCYTLSEGFVVDRLMITSIGRQTNPLYLREPQNIALEA